MKRLFTISMLLVATSVAFGGVARYGVVRDTAISYQPISGTAVTFLNFDDGVSTTPIPIGFTFVYDGFGYSEMKVVANGYAVLGPQATGQTFTNDPTSVTHKPVLAPLWDDLHTTEAGRVTYETVGAVGSRVFTLQYRSIRHFGGAVSDTNMNFQLKLFEGTNEIQFVYGSMASAAPLSYGIAINDPLGGLNHYFMQTVANSTTFSSTAANTILSVIPESNSRYTFTPPAPLALSSISVPSGSYPNLKAVFDTLRNYGTSVPVDILITASTSEAAMVDMDFIPGSLTNAITLKLDAAVSTASVTGSVASPLIRARGLRNFTLDGAQNGAGTTRGLTIENTSATGTAAVQLTEGAQGVLIKNAILKTNHPAGTTTASGVVWFSTTNISSSTLVRGVFGTTSYNTLQNCELTAGASGRPTNGILVNGTTTAGLEDTANVILGNSISNFGGTGTSTAGIRLAGGAVGTIIRSNEIFHTSPALSATTLNGVRIDGSTVGGSVVERNNVHDLNTSATGAPNTYGLVQTAALVQGNTFVNNFVNLAPGDFGTTTPELRGISHQGGNLNVFFNSVRIAGTNTTGFDSSMAFKRTTTTGISNLRNNIFYNGRSAGAGLKRHYGIVLNNNANLISNNNDYHADGTNGVLGSIDGGTTSITTLAGWQAATTQDGASVTQNPNYLSATDLHLNPVIPTQLESGGVTIAGITVDFDGETRDATTPDVGADEGTFILLDLTAPSINYTALTGTPSTANRVLASTITDASGVQADTLGAPRIYYKKGVGGLYASARADSVSGTAYYFTVDSANIGGVVVGDTVYYYVAAQDSIGNSGTNPGGGSGINPPGSTPPPSPNSYVILFSVTSYPYMQDFEGATNENWSTGIFSGTLNVWQRGRPQKPVLNRANSGTHAWVTDTLVSYPNGMNAFVQSPVFDLSGFTVDPLLSFWHKFKVENNFEGMIVEYSTDGGIVWTRLGVLNDPEGVRWYNNTSASGPIPPPKWSGNSTVVFADTGYVKSVRRLTGLAGRSDVRLRFRFGSDASVNDEGWAFDDVAVSAAPTVDYAMLSVTQIGGIPTPFRLVELDSDEGVKGGLVEQLPSPSAGGSRATSVNNSILIDNGSARFGKYGLKADAGDALEVVQTNEPSDILATLPITVRTRAGNPFGSTSPPYEVQWSVGGEGQTPVSRPGIASGAVDSVDLMDTVTVRGTHTTAASAVATGDEDPTNNTAQFLRTLVYPDPMVRVRYDNGGNTPNTFIGFNNPAIPLTSGVRLTAAQAMRIANVDAFYRNEGNADSIEVRVWAAGADTTAPGIMLYSRKYAGANYIVPGTVGSYFTLPLGDDAPAFAAGSDFWLSITYSPLIPFPGGAHNSPLTTPGHSYYSGDGGVTWFQLIITTERAWLLRSVGIPATVQAPVISNVTRSTRVPLAGDSVVVTATVVDSAGLAAARLLYSVDGTVVDTVPMVRTGGTYQNGTYQGVIPGSANADENRVEYQIQANSGSGMSTLTAITAANSYFAGLSTLSLTGPREMAPNRQLLYRNYFARVTGTNNGPNFQTTNTSYFIQDAFGGINLFYFGAPNPALNLGDSVVVVGRMDQFNGLTEIIPDSPAVYVQVVATGRTVPIADLTVAAYQADPEPYEGMLIRFTTIYKRGTTSWPTAGSSANIVMYQTVVTDTVIMRIDSDTDIDGTPEPVYPIQVAGPAQQFSTPGVFNNGYQVSPRYATAPNGPDIRQTIMGSYNVGAGNRLTTLKSMFNLLAGTPVWPSFMVGPATFLLTNASYTDSLLDLGTVAGSSSTNTIAVSPAPSISTTLNLVPNATAPAGMRFTAVSNFTIDGSNSGGTSRDMMVNLADTTGTIQYPALLVRGATSNFAIKNSIVKGNRPTGTAVLLGAVRVDTVAGGQLSSSNIVLDNLHVSRAIAGIVAVGRPQASGQPLQNLEIKNCFIGGAGAQSIVAQGMNLFGTNAARVHDNEIDGVNTGTFAFNCFGLNFSGNTTNAHVYKNKIHNLTYAGAGTGVALGTQFVGLTGFPSRFNVYNNMIWDVNAPTSTNTASAGGPLQGLSFPSGRFDTVYFNSVRISGTSTANNHSSALYIVGPSAAESSRTVVMNNVLVNTSTMGTTARNPVVKLFDGSAGVYGMADYNDYYTSGARGATAAVGVLSTTPIFLNTLLDFQIRTGQDVASVAADPRFDPANLLHVRTDVATPVESFGIPIAGITTDIDGDARDATTPDMGADEGVFVPYALSDITAAFDPGTARVTLSWSTPPVAIILPGTIAANTSEEKPDQEEEAIKLIEFKPTKGLETGWVFPGLGENAESARPEGEASRVTDRQSGKLLVSETVDIGGVAGVAVERAAESDLVSNEAQVAGPVLVETSPVPSVESGDGSEDPVILVQYYIYRSVDGGGYALLDSAGPGGTSYIDSRVEARNYAYFMRAQFNNGTSAPSETAAVNVPFILAELEPNNNAGTANYISLGTALSASITPSGDNDYFRFATATGHLIVDATNTPPNSQRDVIITLYDSSGTNALYQVDRNYNDRLEFNLPYAGLYFARIRGFNAGVTGAYTMFARLGAPTDPYEPDDGPLLGFNQIATSGAIPFSNDTTATLDAGVGAGMGVLFDIDYVQFAGAAGQRIAIIARTGTVGSTVQHAFLGIGRLSQPATLAPSIFGGTPLAERTTTNGSDMVIDTFTLATDTYYAFVTNHFGFGDAEAGPGAHYLLSFDIATGVDDTPVLPTVYALDQNYPNPFNPSTEIRYALPKPSHVRLTVFNVLGQEVISLVNAERDAGFNTVMWNGRNGLGQAVGSGLYFYRIEATPRDGGDTFSDVKKMIMVK